MVPPTLPRSPVRVLYFDHVARLSGGERSLLELLCALDRRCVHPVLALAEEGPLADAARGAGIPVRLISVDEDLRTRPRWTGLSGAMSLATAARTMAAARSLAALIRKEKIRILHTNSLKAHVIGALARLMGRFRLVWHLRDILDRSGLSLMLSSLGWMLPDRILCISGAVADPLRRTWWPGLARRVAVAHNGIRVRDRPDPARFRGSIGIPAGVPLVGMVGQIARWKGQDVFIRAADVVAKSRPDVRFVIVGDVMFPENEQAFRRSLDDLVRELSLESRLVFAGYWPDPLEAMSGLTALVHASVDPEPFGRVLIEAMSIGCPVIATDTGGPREVVEPDRSGILVPPGGAFALAEAILGVLGDPERAERLGREARQRVIELFTVERLAEQVQGVYAELDLA